MANINDVRATNNPQRSYEFEVELIGSTVSGSLPLLTQRVETISIPEVSVETFEINYKGRKTIHAGRDSSPHTVSVTFWDSEAHEVYEFFKGWIDRGISDQVVGGGVTRDQYSAEMVIKMMAADSTTVTREFRLTGVFPTTIGEASLDYTTSDSKKVEVTFSYETLV